MSRLQIPLAASSAWNRRYTLSLVVLSIALSTFLLLSIERLRQDVRTHFAQSVSGTDLIVGARSGSVALMLHTVFRIGQPTQAIRWRSVQELAAHPAVAWTVPIALGDSLRGHPVVGTTPAYFEHFRYGDGRSLAIAAGRRFEATLEAVAGADAAERLGLHLGQRIVLSHGDGVIEGSEHADHPFTVVGILQRTGTPVDRSIHIPLSGIEAMHRDWMLGGPPGTAGSAALGAPPGGALPLGMAGDPSSAVAAPAPGAAAGFDTPPRTLTAVLVGLKNRAGVFSVKRWVDDYRGEALMAILPGVTLDELWEVVGTGEQVLRLMSVLVGVVSLAGLAATILTGLDQRRRELAILRAVGASAGQVLVLLTTEGGLVTLAGVALGVLTHAATVLAVAPWLLAHQGIAVHLDLTDRASGVLVATILAAGWAVSLLPGWRAYRLSLADGLTMRT